MARKLSILVAALGAIGTLSCGPSGEELAATTAAVSARAVDPGNAGGNKLLTVMTRNLFVGGDILAPLVSPDPLGAAAQVWADIQASDFPLRAQGIAAEIAAARPDVVGLQEVYWFQEVDLATGEPTKTIDFLGELQAALAAQGLHYQVAASAAQTTLTIPFPPLGRAVTLIDHDVLLARASLSISEPAGGSFETRIEAVIGGVLPVTVKRGWTSIEVKDQGLEALVVDAHLEVEEVPGAPPGALQFLQGAELLALIDADEERTLLIGDFNSRADVPIPDFWTYGLLTSAFADAWLAFDDPGTGFTCCRDSLTDPGAILDERIDLVLYRGLVTPTAISVVGTSPSSMIDGLWPSDHAGVVATFRLEREKFFVLAP